MATARYGGWMAARFEEILTMGRTCTSPATPGDTLKLLGASMAAPVGESTAAKTSIPDLEKELVLLTSQGVLLSHHKDNIKEEIHKLGTRTQHIRRVLLESARLKFLPHAVGHFVSLLYKANEYFDFKNFANQIPNIENASNQTQLSHIFVKDRQLMSMFPTMDNRDILRAAHAIYAQLLYQYSGNNFYAKPEDPMLNNYIYKLVFQTREKGYEMNMDPILELKKMMKSEPWFYDDHFCLQELCMEHSDEAILEARDKYVNLVRIMGDKYKKPVSHKFKSTARSSRKRSFGTGVIDKYKKSVSLKFKSTARSSRKRSFGTGVIDKYEKSVSLKFKSSARSSRKRSFETGEVSRKRK